MGRGHALMANRQRGEVSFEASGKTWTMKLGTNAWCLVESEMNTDLASIDLSRLSMRNVRTIFWASLQHHHESVSISDAGDLMDIIGTAKTTELVTQAIELQAPEGDKKNPPRVAATAA
jgi:hypothetical protein